MKGRRHGSAFLERQRRPAERFPHEKGQALGLRPSPLPSQLLEPFGEFLVDAHSGEHDGLPLIASSAGNTLWYRRAEAVTLRHDSPHAKSVP